MQADCAAFEQLFAAALPVRKHTGRGDESGFVPRPHQQRAVEADAFVGPVSPRHMTKTEWLSPCVAMTVNQERARVSSTCPDNLCSHFCQALVQKSDAKALLLAMPCGTGKTLVVASPLVSLFTVR